MGAVRIEDEIMVHAPAGEIWSAIKDPAAHAAWHPFLARIDGEHRLGATRSCLVEMGNRTGETRERCIEEDEGRALTWIIVSDSTGFSRMTSDWRAGFLVHPADGATRVTAHSEFEPANLVVRAMTPVIRRRFHRTQRLILASLKRTVESASRPARGRASEGSS